MPPVPVITPLCAGQPHAGDCFVIGCDGKIAAAWYVTHSGRIFGQRWTAGDTVELCREHHERAACITGAEDYLHLWLPADS